MKVLVLTNKKSCSLVFIELENMLCANLESRYKDDALQTACLKGAAEIFQYLIDTLPYRYPVHIHTGARYTYIQVPGRL